ncbi:MAG: hypothetical protein H7315_06820 [Herminiimonas sp.]|nr:hypothetical protein [Herminiimonas sp.]
MLRPVSVSRIEVNQGGKIMNTVQQSQNPLQVGTHVFTADGDETVITKDNLKDFVLEPGDIVSSTDGTLAKVMADGSEEIYADGRGLTADTSDDFSALDPSTKSFWDMWKKLLASVSPDQGSALSKLLDQINRYFLGQDAQDPNGAGGDSGNPAAGGNGPVANDNRLYSGNGNTGGSSASGGSGGGGSGGGGSGGGGPVGAASAGGAAGHATEPNKGGNSTQSVETLPPSVVKDGGSILDQFAARNGKNGPPFASGFSVNNAEKNADGSVTLHLKNGTGAEIVGPVAAKYGSYTVQSKADDAKGVDQSSFFYGGKKGQQYMEADLMETGLSPDPRVRLSGFWDQGKKIIDVASVPEDFGFKEWPPEGMTNKLVFENGRMAIYTKNSQGEFQLVKDHDTGKPAEWKDPKLTEQYAAENDFKAMHSIWGVSGKWNGEDSNYTVKDAQYAPA